MTTYSTNFAGTEDPLSEGGVWGGGLIPGLLWLDCLKVPGMAQGKRVGGTGDTIDPTAILTGFSWGSQQVAQATCVFTDTSQQGSEELEIRLNTTLAANSAWGYEVMFGATGFVAIIAWDSPKGTFRFLTANVNLPRALQTGDVLKGAREGNDIVAYFNGTEYARATDTTYMGGAPGFGLNNYAPGATDPTIYGYSAFSATDGVGTGPLLWARGMI